MKTIVSILLLTLSTATLANSYVDYLRGLSWSELRANYDVDFEGDKIWFGGSQFSVFDTCMASNKVIRTKNKVTIEVLDEDDFEVVGYDYLYKSVNSTRTIVDYDSTIDVPYTVPVTRTIDVVSLEDEFDAEFYFSRSFTIPACK